MWITKRIHSHQDITALGQIGICGKTRAGINPKDTPVNPDLTWFSPGVIFWNLPVEIPGILQYGRTAEIGG
jgi:hypothetical protein